MKKVSLLLSILMVLMSVFPTYAQITPAIEQALNFKDYAQNGGFENGTGKWKTYADSAGAQPVDCIGGSPAVSLSASTSSPIQGKASGVLTKPASNVQGHGYAMDFPIDKDAKAKFLSVNASYEVVSGTYSGGTPSTDSDLTAYIYDVDGGQIIQPIGFKFDGAVTNNTYSLSAMFQTPSFSTDSRNLRLCLHQATTSTSANVLRIDKIKITSQTKSTGYVKTAPAQYQPTWTGLGTVSSNSMYWQRDGGDLILWGFVIVGSPTNNAVTFTLPSGLSIDSARLSSNVARRHNFGYANRITNGATVYSDATAGATMAVVYQGTGSNTPQLVYTMGADAYADVNATAMLVGGNAISIPHLRIPIAGWDVGTQVSDQFDGRVVAAYARTSTNTVPASPGPTTWTTAVVDTHGGMASSSYTVKVPGLYSVDVAMTVAPTATTGGTMFLDIHVDGSSVMPSLNGVGTPSTGQNYTNTAKVTVNLRAGQVITVPIAQNTGSTMNIASAQLNIVRLSGLSQIAASETISMSYSSTSGQSFSNNVATIFVPTTKQWDSHGIYNTSNGEATIPVSGKYLVNCGLSWVSLTSASSQMTIAIHKNGSVYKQKRFDSIPSTTATYGPIISATVDALSTDKITCVALQGNGASRALTTEAGANYFEITKVAN